MILNSRHKAEIFPAEKIRTYSTNVPITRKVLLTRKSDSDIGTGKDYSVVEATTIRCLVTCSTSFILLILQKSIYPTMKRSLKYLIECSN